MMKNKWKKVALINGPNLNMLGVREPEIYGVNSLKDINKKIKKEASFLKIEIDFFQSNHEGEIVDFIQEEYNNCNGIIINPGGLTHYSIVLKDALNATNLPIIEVHISNIYKREQARHKSVIAPIAIGQICGFGPEGYLYALKAMTDILEDSSVFSSLVKDLAK